MTGPLFPIHPDCPHCNLTAQAIAWVGLRWIAAGIDLKDGDVSEPTIGNEKAPLQRGLGE